MRTLLAIDPGASTGAVLVTGPLRRLTAVAGITTSGYDPTPVFDLLDHDPLMAVVEEPPVQGADRELDGLYGTVLTTLAREGIPYFTMKPSAWKPVAKKLRVRPPDLGTRHERDAYLMAWVFIRNRKVAL